MTLKIEKCLLKGSVSAPPSKSDGHRVLICSALSSGSTVKNLADSEDIKATLGCLKSLGAKTENTEKGLKIGGINPFYLPDNVILDCNESGSTLRFLIPLCLISGKKVSLKGKGRLMERPLIVYEKICEERGIFFKKNGDTLTLCGKLESGVFAVDGGVSSQFISGLMYALPLLPSDSQIKIEGVLESKPYIDMTVETLGRFGVEIKETDYGYFIKGNQEYGSRSITVEGDWSNAAFLDGFNLLGGNVTVKGLNENSLQGDKIYKKMYEALKSGDKNFDLSNCPDLAPVMFALAAALGGAEFTGTARLKIKESDRAEVMKEELSKFGINVKVEENRVTVLGGVLKAPKEKLKGHNDHRIVMALTLLCTLVGGEIEGIEAVNKSFPDFFSKISALGFVAHET